MTTLDKQVSAACSRAALCHSGQPRSIRPAHGSRMPFLRSRSCSGAVKAGAQQEPALVVPSPIGAGQLGDVSRYAAAISRGGGGGRGKRVSVAYWLTRPCLMPLGWQSQHTADTMDVSDTGHGAPCAICYSYRLDDAIPDRVCDNERCARPFHSMCLVEWLRSSADARTSFDTVFGACPYCSEAIFAKVA